MCVKRNKQFPSLNWIYYSTILFALLSHNACSRTGRIRALEFSLWNIFRIRVKIVCGISLVLCTMFRLLFGTWMELMLIFACFFFCNVYEPIVTNCTFNGALTGLLKRHIGHTTSSIVGKENWYL